MDIFGILKFYAKLKPDSLALVDDASEMTFLHLESNVRRIARLLQNNEIDSSSLVCTMLPSTLDLQVTLALHMLGAPSFSKPEGSKPDSILMPDWLISTQLNSNFPEDRTFVLDSNFEKAVNQTDRIREAPGFSSPDEIARYFFTSGSSGSSKYLAVSAANLFAKTKLQGSNELVGERELLNLFRFGSSQKYGTALRALFEGRTFYTCDYFDYRLPKILSKYPIKTVVGSPVQIGSMIDSLIQTGTKAPGVRTIIMTGSAPTKIQINRIRQHLGARIYNGYGSTELGFVSLREITDGKNNGASISPDVNLEIVDSNEKILPTGETGIIRYAKAKMPKGYISSEEASSQYFKNDFFYPGDLGYLDELGRIHISGRTNEVINLGGVKVNPETLEDIALQVPGVKDAAAFTIIDKTGIKRLALAYVKDSGFVLSALEKVCNEEFRSINVAKFLEVAEIPRNENGKIPRAKLAEIFLTQGSTNA